MTLSLFVVWCNVGLSAVAALVCGYASRHTFPELRPAFAAAATLAVIYVGCYVWLAFNIERTGDWSDYVRAMGLIAWPVAWMFPPALSVVVWFRIHRTFGGGRE